MMLSVWQKNALLHTLAYEVEIAEEGSKRDWMSLIGCRFEDIDEVLETTRQMGFHFVDTELFRYRHVTTEEFCRVIDFDKQRRFILLLPRQIPFSVSYFLYNVADQGVVSTDQSNPWESGVPFAEKAFVLVITVDDWEELEFETGWDRSKLDRVTGNYCWLHDNRYD